MSLFIVLLAAGKSLRLNSNIPKPYIKLNNKTLIEHTINTFNKLKIKKTIVLVYNEKHKNLLEKIKLNKEIIKIKGGKNRQVSTFNALKKISKLNCKKVLIHDVARPNLSLNLINRVIKKTKKNHAVIPVIKPYDAAKRISKNIVFKNIERNSLRFSQTPQGFTFEKIYLKHKQNLNKNIDDDSTLFTENHEKVITVHGEKTNFKITDKEDLGILNLLKKNKTYYGIGFDVHRLVAKRKLYLGGLKIHSKLGTLGHSDGDPVLHAIIDSLLGASKKGDIGEKFSNKNKIFKNIRSTILLKKVMNQLRLNKYYINNMDINIITQTPKIKKYKKKIITNISKLCGISKNKINVKGKTTEKLGIIGKEKAIACEVITSINKND